MLLRLIDQLPDDTDPHRRARMARQLRTARRVEFTLVTERGQDKGHAIVSDDLNADFLLPRDTKREVRLVSGQAFVGLNFVHGHADMRLDVQSLINLYPFFTPHQLANWLRAEGDLFLHALQSGDVATAVARFDAHEPSDAGAAWPLRQYLADGGDIHWFRAHVRAFANQHLRRLNESTLAKRRLPIPGGRYYVMPHGIGQRAGLRLRGGRGEVLIDPAAGTAWVSDEDWLQLEGSNAGIAGILGGADNDDALWLHPFTDHDGVRRVLAWRAPNQAGEYVLRRPAPGSFDLPWTTIDGTLDYPQGDSRRLVARTDQQPALNYQNLVDPATAGGLGEGQAYMPDVMTATIARAAANSGALGAYCNQLMLAKALTGGLPADPPAALETIIDASVKSGEDLSPVLA